MEELAAGQIPGGAEERAPFSPISPTVPPLSLSIFFFSPFLVWLPVSRLVVPTRFNAHHGLSLSSQFAVSLLSVCISRAATRLHVQSGSPWQLETLCGTSILSLVIRCRTEDDR